MPILARWTLRKPNSQVKTPVFQQGKSIVFVVRGNIWHASGCLYGRVCLLVHLKIKCALTSEELCDMAAANGILVFPFHKEEKKRTVMHILHCPAVKFLRKSFQMQCEYCAKLYYKSYLCACTQIST